MLAVYFMEFLFSIKLKRLQSRNHKGLLPVGYVCFPTKLFVVVLVYFL
jgi:hypothetical protein